MMRNISILYMYKHALHDDNSYDVKATPNHTHHLTWPHTLTGLTTSELPEPPLEGGMVRSCLHFSATTGMVSSPRRGQDM